LQWNGPVLSIPMFGQWLVLSATMVLALTILFAGAVGTARLALDAHEPVDLYRGYAAGFGAVLVAAGLMG